MSLPSNDSATRLDYLLGNAWAGELTPAESDELHAWLSADEARAEWADQLRHGAILSARPPVRGDREAFVARLSSAMSSAEPVVPRHLEVPPRGRPAPRVGVRHSVVRSRWMRGIAVVAAIACVWIGGATWWQGRRTPNAITQAAASATMTTHATARGQRAQIALPDGSTVLLAPDSKLRYAVGFGTTTRTVEIDGAALFTVAHTDGVPFEVRAGRTAVRVLGTEFTVQRYATDTAVRVAVAQGKVAVGASVLTSGDIAVASAAAVSVRHNQPLGDELAWTQGRLVFVATPLREVAAALGRWYDADVVIGDVAIADRRVTATFEHETLTQALESIRLAVHVRATSTRTGTAGPRIVLSQ